MSANELDIVQGNEQADLYAKQGADLDANFGRSQAIQKWTEKVHWALRAAADLHVACGKEGWLDAEAGTVPPKKKKEPRRVLEIGPRVPHILQRTQQTALSWQCVRCGRQAKSWKGKGALEATCCAGSFAARLPIQERKWPFGHKIFQTGDMLMWCGQRGCYATTKLRGLKQPCPGPPVAETTVLRRLRQGLHPVTRKPMGQARRIC